MASRVLVVGGCGFIGGYLTDRLRQAGHDTHVYDNLTYEGIYLKDVPFTRGDIRDTDRVVAVAERFDNVIWLAAIVGDGACAQDPELTFEVNYHSLRRFLERTKRRVLFTSTCSVYGAQDGILDESSPIRPLSVYAESKAKAEGEVLSHGGLVFRLGTLYGQGDTYSRLRLDLVVNVLTLKALTENKVTVFGGDQWRPILSVRDVAGYFLEAVSTDHKGVFNLAKENVRIRDLAHCFKDIFPNLQIETVDTKFEDARNYQVSVQKALATFRFRPQITVVEELKRLKAILEAGRIKNPLDPVYYNAHFVKAQLADIRPMPMKEAAWKTSV